MASVTWNNAGSGAWATGSNWSTGAVPGAADDATINNGAVSTITYSGLTSSISSLYLGGVDTLSQASGALTILSYATMYGGLTQSGGSLVFAGGSSYLGGTLTQTAGTIAIASSVLQLAGTADVLGGTVTGAGELNIAYGSTTFASTLSLGTGAVSQTGGVLTLGSSRTYAGAWQQNGGTLALGGNTLTLAGTADLSSGYVSGSGGVTLSGSTELGSVIFTGAQTISSGATLTQTAGVHVGYQATDTVSFTNKSGALYQDYGNSSIYGVSGSSFTNAGRLVFYGGATTSVQVGLTNSATGTLTVTQGVLQLYNATNVLGGTVGGGGTLDFYYGSVQLAAGLSLTTAGVIVDSSSQVTLGDDLSYAGNWVQTSGSVALGGKTLTLSGAAVLGGGQVNGAGTLTLGGSTTLGGWYQLGSTVVTNSGTVNQTGDWRLGYNAADTASASNLAGALWRLASNATIYSVAGAQYKNYGTLQATGFGIENIYAKLTNATGATLAITGGTVRLSGTADSLGGTISGKGELDLYSGSHTFAAGLALSVANVALEGGIVTVAGGLSYQGAFAQNGGTLSINGSKLFNLQGAADLWSGSVTGAGTLALSGTSSLYNLYLLSHVQLVNNKTLNQSGDIHLGYNSGDTVQATNGQRQIWNVLDAADIYATSGSTLTNRGTIAVAAGAAISAVQATVVNAGTSTIAVNSGTLRLQGTGDSLAGTISGAGTLDMYGGSHVLASGVSLTVATLIVDSGSAVTLGGNVAYAGNFVIAGGTLSLGGATLSLSGPATFEGGYVTGSGTVLLTAASELSSEYLLGSTALTNTGTVSQVGNIQVGYNTGDTVTATNAAGGLWRLLNGSTIGGTSGSSFVNAGTLATGGAGLSQIQVAFSDTGVLSVDADTLRLTATGNSLGGLVGGSGSLDLYSGSTQLGSGVTLAVANVAVDYSVVTLSGNLAYAGAFVQNAGTLALAGKTLTLSGAAALGGGQTNGSGTLALTGTSSLASYYITGSTAVTNSGTVQVNANVTVGYNAGDTAKLVNLAGATMVLTSGVVINGVSGSTFSNAGTAKLSGAGSSQVTVAFINTGNVLVGSHGMTFAGTISGSGTISATAGGTLAVNGAVASGQLFSLGAGSELDLGLATSFAGTISQFTTGDVMEFTQFAFSNSTATFNAGSNVLTVANGSSTASIKFTAGHSAGEFRSFNDHGYLGVVHT